MKQIHCFLKSSACIAACLAMTGVVQATPIHRLSSSFLAAKQELVIKVADELRYPPRDPFAPPSKPLTQEDIQKTIDNKLKQRFEAAAGPESHVLSSEQAKAVGWGLIADHFTEIDRNGDGFVTLDDISNYMDGRSPLNSKALRRSASKSVQTIE